MTTKSSIPTGSTKIYTLLAGSVEGPNKKMLLDPFEEQFHLPALLVDVGNGPRRQGKVVGQKLQALVALGIEVAHLPEGVGIGGGGFQGGQNHGLIREHARALIHR